MDSTGDLAPWPAAPDPLPPIDDYAHVYRFSLDLPDEQQERAFAALDDQGRERAARYHEGAIRRRFIAAQGQMRQVLAALCGLSPADLRLERAPQGKPFCPGSSLRFNLSHSGALGLLAVCKGQEIGVDLEDTRRPVDYTTIARRFFAPAEFAELEALPPDEQRAAFFRCWTRKEAYIKARGGGLSIPLGSFRVSLAPGEPPRLTGAPPGWQLYALEPGRHYAAALVTQRPLPGVRCWTWPPA